MTLQFLLLFNYSDQKTVAEFSADPQPLTTDLTQRSANND